jgi:hypothetical protein
VNIVKRKKRQVVELTDRDAAYDVLEKEETIKVTFQFLSYSIYAQILKYKEKSHLHVFGFSHPPSVDITGDNLLGKRLNDEIKGLLCLLSVIFFFLIKLKTRMSVATPPPPTPFLKPLLWK